MKTKHIFRILLLIPIIYYIFASRNYISFLAGNKTPDKNKIYLSEPFKIDNKGEISFCINNKNWPYIEELRKNLLLVSVIFKYNDTIEYHNNSNFIFEFNAFTKSKDSIINRIVYDENNTNNKIVFKTMGKGSCRYDIKNYIDKYRIGIVSNPNYYDDLIIKLNILREDSILNRDLPRLLIEDYSTRDVGFQAIDVLYFDIIIILCVICLLIIILMDIIKLDKTTKTDDSTILKQ